VINGHLGERITALVDGELSHDARDRALAHLAGCDHCRAAVDAERLTKGRVAALDAGGVEPGPSPELMARLRDVARPDEPSEPPGGGGFPAATFPSMTSFPIAKLRPHARPADGQTDGTTRRARQQFGARVAVAGSLK
jgi:anti-sigma factor RsiW